MPPTLVAPRQKEWEKPADKVNIYWEKASLPDSQGQHREQGQIQGQKRYQLKGR